MQSHKLEANIYHSKIQQIEQDFEMLTRHLQTTEDEATELGHYFISYLPLQIQNCVTRCLAETHEIQVVDQLIEYLHANHKEFKKQCEQRKRLLPNLRYQRKCILTDFEACLTKLKDQQQLVETMNTEKEKKKAYEELMLRNQFMDMINKTDNVVKLLDESTSNQFTDVRKEIKKVEKAQEKAIRELEEKERERREKREKKDQERANKEQEKKMKKKNR